MSTRQSEAGSGRVQGRTTIVRAGPGDLDALERIESQCFGASVAISRRQFRYLLRAPGASVYVLRTSGSEWHGHPQQGRVGLAPADHGRDARGTHGRDGHATRVAGDAIVVRRRGKAGPLGTANAHVAARIYSLAVAPEHRGRKFGKALLIHCLTELRKEGAMDATLEVAVDNAPAIALYESLGFEKARRLGGYYGPGQDAWRMKLKFV